MAPSPADFASIVELMEIKRLYEEQEERWRQRTLEKDEVNAQLEGQVAAMRQELTTTSTTAAELRNQLEAASWLAGPRPLLRNLKPGFSSADRRPLCRLVHL